MTGKQLAGKASKLNVNPYFLAYALATDAQSVEAAWKRDGNGAKFMAWNGKAWDITCARIGADRYACSRFVTEHLETLAKLVSAKS